MSRTYKKAQPVETTEKCKFGCGQIAKFQNRAGNYTCEVTSSKCPEVRQKNSQGLRDCGRDYAADYAALPQESKDRIAWARGLTKDTDERIKRAAINATGVRRTTDAEVLRKILYREQCEFDLRGSVHTVEGYELLKQFGMYHRVTNQGGVVRDHIISVAHGFSHGIEPKIISNIANCRFLLHADNARKTFLCGMTLDELRAKIEKQKSPS
jgi:hypothetical protein